jgi:hypothetical protein
MKISRESFSWKVGTGYENNIMMGVRDHCEHQVLVELVQTVLMVKIPQRQEIIA